MRYVLPLILTVLVLNCATLAATKPSLVAAAAPKTGDINIAANGSLYLDFAYYDWGPNWTGIKRTQKASEGQNVTSFSYENIVNKTKAAFAVQGTWKQTAPDTFRYEARLNAASSTPIQLAQLSVSPGDAFADVAATFKFADGSTRSHVFPLAKGSISGALKELTLTDKHGQSTRIVFDEPTEVSSDKQLRLILAKEKIEAGKTYPLAFTVTLPAPAKFIPGPSAVAGETKNWYPFDAAKPITEKSEWSLASWLEKPAGKHGRILSNGDDLIYNSSPIKLWGINLAYSDCAPDAALADKRADFYAALGINAVRLHKYADGPGWSGIATSESARSFEAAKLAKMDYFVAALKKRGIYVKLSPVFIVKLGPGDRETVPFMDELGEMKGSRLNPKHGSFFISTELQDILIEQTTSLLRHKNPHTGQTYAEDPAIAYVEIYNEDCALFGGVSKVIADSPTLRKRTGAQFAAWLKNKYKDEASFLKAWGKEALNSSLLKNQSIPLDESWSEDRIYPAGNPWFFDPSQLEGSQRPFRRRLLDTIAFLYELQNQVYARFEAAIRATGYAGEIISTNWQSGRAISHFYNLHSDARIGTVDRHNYFGGSRSEPFVFNNNSMLSIPGGGTMSASLQQVAGRPFMLSEWIHVIPNEWGVEGPAIIGAYGLGLQGWDVSFPFQNTDSGTFNTAIGQKQWEVAAPNFLGIFPAVSRQVLRGDVRTSDVVHTRNVHIPSLDEGNVGFDDRVLQQWDIKTFDSDVFPAQALAAARGIVKFTESFTATPTFDLSPYRDGDAIISATKQLRWQPGAHEKDGHIVINTPGTQAVVGFAQGRSYDLENSSLRLDSHYAALYLSARSKDKTIATDTALLISAIARARNPSTRIAEDTFFYTHGASKKDSGPVLMEPVQATITLKRDGKPTVHILNHVGEKTGRTIPLKNNTFQIDTARDASPYYLIEFVAN